MSTITLPNIRVGSDLQVRARLKDGGVAIDWSTLQNIKACIYSDAQRALAGRCAFSIDEEDSTLLVCTYAANKPQYLGENRIVISAKYMGETKTYDKPAFSFVRWTADQEGEEITIDDPDVDVEIDVEDISSSILQEAVDAAFEAADRANDAAAAAEHMVDIHTGPEGKSAYEVAVEEGYTGTEDEWLASLVGPQGAQGIQGETGEAAGFGTVSVSLQEDGGQPSATVAASGTDTAKNFAFTFNNLKGEKGDKGDQGNSGYTGAAGELEVVNNLTDGGAAKALSAEMGKTLEGEVSQLEAKVTDIEDDLEVKDPLLFDYESNFEDITSFTELTATLVRKSNNKIEAGTTQGVLYFPVVAGKRYKVILSNLYCVNAYSIVSFCSVTPAIGADTTLVYGVATSDAYTATVDFTAPSDGYLLAIYNAVAQKDRISAKGEVFVPVAKFVDKDDVDSELSLISENPVKNNVITERINEVEGELKEAIVSYEDETLTDFNGYIVRKSNNTIETGNAQTGILYFPVVAGTKYKILLNNLYCQSAYSTVSFSTVVPALNGTTTPIWGVETTDAYTETITYTPTANGYILVLYNATVQRANISAQEEVITYVDKYAEQRPWKDKKWTVVGDSLTEVNRRTLKNYHGFVHDETGIVIQNLGISGTGYANGIGNNNAFYNRVSQIANDTDVITVFGSFNDMAASLPLGSVTDTGFTSICGCINEALSAIQTAFPLVNLGVVTPTPWAGHHPTSAGNSDGELYVDAIVNICKLRSIPCLDLFHCSNLRPWDADFRAVAYRRDGTYTESTEGTTGAVQVTADILGYVQDYGGLPNAQVGDWVLPHLGGVHPDERGHKLIATRFESFLKSLLF